MSDIYKTEDAIMGLTALFTEFGVRFTVLETGLAEALGKLDGRIAKLESSLGESQEGVRIFFRRRNATTGTAYILDRHKSWHNMGDELKHMGALGKSHTTFSLFLNNQEEIRDLDEIRAGDTIHVYPHGYKPESNVAIDTMDDEKDKEDRVEQIESDMTQVIEGMRATMDSDTTRLDGRILANSSRLDSHMCKILRLESSLHCIQEVEKQLDRIRKETKSQLDRVNEEVASQLEKLTDLHTGFEDLVRLYSELKNTAEEEEEKSDLRQKIEIMQSHLSDMQEALDIHYQLHIKRHRAFKYANQEKLRDLAQRIDRLEEKDTHAKPQSLPKDPPRLSLAKKSTLTIGVSPLGSVWCFKGIG